MNVLDDFVNAVTDVRRLQQREKYRGKEIAVGQDVVQIEDRQPYKRPPLTPWEESLKRMARAQAMLWHRADIKEKWAILAEVDAEQHRSEQ